MTMKPLMIATAFALLATPAAAETRTPEDVILRELCVDQTIPGESPSSRLLRQQICRKKFPNLNPKDDLVWQLMRADK
jgi:hypothetical protein